MYSFDRRAALLSLGFVFSLLLCGRQAFAQACVGQPAEMHLATYSFSMLRADGFGSGVSHTVAVTPGGEFWGGGGIDTLQFNGLDGHVSGFRVFGLYEIESRRSSSLCFGGQGIFHRNNDNGAQFSGISVQDYSLYTAASVRRPLADWLEMILYSRIDLGWSRAAFWGGNVIETMALRDSYVNARLESGIGFRLAVFSLGFAWSSGLHFMDTDIGVRWLMPDNGRLWIGAVF